MMSKALVTVCAYFIVLLSGVEGVRIRTLCKFPAQFRCDDGQCIEKKYWCNNNYECIDMSDEKYCSKNYYIGNCLDNLHFRCKFGQCIPNSGRCDGYNSCPDGTDEEDCPCVNLSADEEEFEFEAFISAFQTYNKCWRLTVNEGKYLKLKIEKINMYSRDCMYGNVTISKLYGKVRTFCPGNSNSRRRTHPLFSNQQGLTYLDQDAEIQSNFEFNQDVEIKYRSGWWDSNDNNEMRDYFHISYKLLDTLCKSPGVFKCDDHSCIYPEKQCDGRNDCENGLDERNCESGALLTAHVEINRRKAVQWLKSQQTVDYGWKENTHRAIVALHLAQGVDFDTSSKDADLMTKQLELQISTVLLRNEEEEMTPTQLSMFTNALLAVCHDPRHFYGFDLIAKLKQKLEKSEAYAHPLSYLTLCSANETISLETTGMLLQILETSSDAGYILEIQAAAAMALTCIATEKKFHHLQQNVTNALNAIKSEQMDNGSFGNAYTTALVVQALIANNQTEGKDWNLKAAIGFLKQRQDQNGSFGDFLTTYFILPVLNDKSLVDIGKVNCTESLKRRKNDVEISNIQSKLGNKTSVKYSLFVGDEKDQIHPIILRIPQNITILQLMTLAADVDSKYKFKTHTIKGKNYVYEILGIPNDPEDSKFWFMYRGQGNSSSAFIPTQSPDEVTVNNKEHIIMWYKTLDFM